MSLMHWFILISVGGAVGVLFAGIVLTCWRVWQRSKIAQRRPESFTGPTPTTSIGVGFTPTEERVSLPTTNRIKTSDRMVPRYPDEDGNDLTDIVVAAALLDGLDSTVRFPESGPASTEPSPVARMPEPDFKVEMAVPGSVRAVAEVEIASSPVDEEQRFAAEDSKLTSNADWDTGSDWDSDYDSYSSSDDF